jgi:hypothetical protein
MLGFLTTFAQNVIKYDMEVKSAQNDMGSVHTSRGQVDFSDEQYIEKLPSVAALDMHAGMRQRKEKDELKSTEDR